MSTFNWQNFRKFYYASTTYQKKEALAKDFFDVWWDVCGAAYSLGKFNSIATIKSCFNASNKKSMKVRLIAKGYTPASIDGIYKYLATWLSANK